VEEVRETEPAMDAAIAMETRYLETHKKVTEDIKSMTLKVNDRFTVVWVGADSWVERTSTLTITSCPPNALCSVVDERGTENDVAFPLPPNSRARYLKLTRLAADLPNCLNDWALTPSFRDLRHTDRRHFSRVLENILEPYDRASDDEKSAIWSRLASYIKEYVKKGGSNKKKPMSAQVRVEKSQEELRIHRAKVQMQYGNLGRAVRTLAQEDDHDLSELERVQKMRSLHPPGDPAPPIPPESHDVSVVIGEEDVKRVVKRMCDGAAPGPTGWTAELLAIAIEHSTINSRVITSMISDIANKRVCPNTIKMLTRSFGIPIPKPNRGVRPLALGELFVKIASKIVLESEMETIKEYFGDIQLGIGAEKGCERISHDIARIKKLHPEFAIATIDATNAFNSPGRPAMALEVYHPRWRRFHKLFELEYGQTAEVLMRSGYTLESRCGSRQGTVLGGLYYCIAMHPCLMELQQKYPDVHVRGYFDDVTLIGPPDDVANAFRLYATLISAKGVAVNASKSEWLGPAPSVLPVGVKTRLLSIKVLGTFIGEDGDCATELLELVKVRSVLFQRIMALPEHYAFALLVQAMVPKMTFVIRTHHPDVSRAACEHFDGEVLEAAQMMLGSTFNEVTRQLAHLPARHGGVGLARSADLAALAYGASNAECAFAAGVLNGTPPASQHDQSEEHFKAIALQLKKDDAVLARHMESCSEHYCDWFRNPLGPLMKRESNPREFAAAMRLRLRSPLNGLRASLCCPGCGDSFESKAWQDHVTGCTRMTGSNCSSTHTDLKEAVRGVLLHGGIRTQQGEPRDYQTYTCGCGVVLKTLDDATRHATSCRRANGTIPHPSGPDLMVDLPRSRVLVDVTVIRPTLSSYIDKSLVKLAGDREAVKNGKYAEQAQRDNADFVVFTMFANGGMSKNAMKFVEAMVNDAVDISKGEVMHELRRAVEMGQGRALYNAECLATRSGGRLLRAVKAKATRARKPSDPLPLLMQSQVDVDDGVIHAPSTAVLTQQVDLRPTDEDAVVEHGPTILDPPPEVNPHTEDLVPIHIPQADGIIPPPPQPLQEELPALDVSPLLPAPTPPITRRPKRHREDAEPSEPRNEPACNTRRVEAVPEVPITFEEIETAIPPPQTPAVDAVSFHIIAEMIPHLPSPNDIPNPDSANIVVSPFVSAPDVSPPLQPTAVDHALEEGRTRAARRLRSEDTEEMFILFYRATAARRLDEL
jgi:hypothetical protein